MPTLTSLVIVLSGFAMISYPYLGSEPLLGWIRLEQLFAPVIAL